MRGPVPGGTAGTAPGQGPQGEGQGTQGRQAGTGSPQTVRQAGPEGRQAGAQGRRGRDRGQRGSHRRRPRETPRRLSRRRVPVPATHPALPAAVYGDPRHIPALRGLGADGKASRGAKVKGQEAPQHLGFFWHGTRLNVAQRGVDRKTNETTVIGPVIDGMDLAGVCLTVDALHSLVDLNKRVLARGGHVIFVIKGNQPSTYQALNTIAWEQIPVAAATFEADRGRIETRTIQVAAAPAGLKYPGMRQAALIERYTTFKDKEGKAVTRSETVLILTTADACQAPPADLLALNRGHWAATGPRPTTMASCYRYRSPQHTGFRATVGSAWIAVCSSTRPRSVSRTSLYCLLSAGPRSYCPPATAQTTADLFAGPNCRPTTRTLRTEVSCGDLENGPGEVISLVGGCSGRAVTGTPTGAVHQSVRSHQLNPLTRR